MIGDPIGDPIGPPIVQQESFLQEVGVSVVGGMAVGRDISKVLDVSAVVSVAVVRAITRTAIVLAATANVAIDTLFSLLIRISMTVTGVSTLHRAIDKTVRPTVRAVVNLIANALHVISTATLHKPVDFVLARAPLFKKRTGVLVGDDVDRGVGGSRQIRGRGPSFTVKTSKGR